MHAATAHGLNGGSGRTRGSARNRPIAGPLNSTGIDESTDAYDAIDWLVKNVPESNGKVGVIGSSYLGFTTLPALYWPLVGLTLLCYVLLTQGVKTTLLRRNWI